MPALVVPPSRGLRHPRNIGVKKFAIKTLRTLKGIPGLGEAEEKVPIANAVEGEVSRCQTGRLADD